MTPQELKNSILQLAIQGKLVEQRPEEGTAEELYQQIQAEKQKLIKEGKIKKEKPLPEIIEDEKPFDIPESWIWCYVGEVFQHNTGKALNGSDHSGEMMTYITTSNLYWDRFELDKLKEMPFTESEVEKCTIRKGDLLVCEGGDYGRAAIWLYDQSMRIQNHIHRLRPYVPVSVRYFYYCFYLYKNSGMIAGKGIGIQGLSSNALHILKMPLPPLAEQKRIVAKIEELLPLIDRYEKAWSRLEEFNKRFPDDIQKSILQMAIQGKLLEQWPEEGTGDELYQQIQAEKQKLIKAGKIKKEKPLLEITEDEKPFDIPESWRWARLESLSEIIGDGIHGTPEYDINGNYYFINGNNLSNGNIVYKDDTQKVSEEEYQKYKKPLRETTILLSINGTIGNIAYYNNEPVILGKSACYITLLHGLYRPYLSILLKSKFFLDFALQEATQTTIKNVSLKAIRMFPIPLPPLAEQKRIVAKLEEILPLCEKLKNEHYIILSDKQKIN